jgi:iron-sulfur cluster assembly protein
LYAVDAHSVLFKVKLGKGKHLTLFEKAGNLYFCRNSEIMETTTLCPVQFTDNAISEVERLMNRPDFESGKFLRVGVKGGGCSGMTYVLGFDEKVEQDELYTYKGIPFIMDRSHGMYLYGMEIDWQDGLNARGFVFNNPNASKTCGCGTSFSV